MSYTVWLVSHCQSTYCASQGKDGWFKVVLGRGPSSVQVEKWKNIVQLNSTRNTVAITALTPVTECDYRRGKCSC